MWESCTDNVWESVKKCSNLCKVARTRNWFTAGKPLDDAYEWSMQRRWKVTPAGALQNKKSSLAILFARGLNSWLSQVARLSRQPALFWKTWLFAFYSHSSINTPHTHEILRASRENIERDPKEKQDWLIHNLHIETLQIPLLLSSLLLHPWEVHYQNLFSPYTHMREGHLVLGKRLGRDQFHIGWCYGL